VAPGLHNFYVAADGQLGFGGMVDIDAVAVEYFTRAQNGEMTFAQANQAINDSVLKHESNVAILVGGVQIFGGLGALAACPATSGVSCLLLTGAFVSAPNVALGVNDASEGVAQWMSGENERTAIENALIDAGYSAEDAAGYLGNAQMMVGIIDIGAGGILAIKGPKGIVKVGSGAPSNGAGAGTNSVPNPPSLTISNTQWGIKSAQHMGDFGLDVTNPAHRQKFRDMVENIGSNHDRVVAGSFSGGGPTGRREVLFYI
jgi:hypothetical protein